MLARPAACVGDSLQHCWYSSASSNLELAEKLRLSCITIGAIRTGWEPDIAPINVNLFFAEELNQLANMDI